MLESNKVYSKEDIFGYIFDMSSEKNRGWEVEKPMHSCRNNSYKICLRRDSQTLYYRAIDYSVPNQEKHELHIIGVLKDSSNRRNSTSKVVIFSQVGDNQYVMINSGYPLSSYRIMYGKSN